MYIPKRWLVPGAVCVALLGAIVVTLLTSVIGGGGSSGPGSGEAAVRLNGEAVTVEPQSAPAAGTATAATGTDPFAQMTPEQQQAFAAFVQGSPAAAPGAGLASASGVDARPVPTEESIEIGDFATNSGIIWRSQFNDGGFGDIGMQWWQVRNNAPVTNQHTSGNHDTTNVVVGNGNVVGAPAGTPSAPLSKPVAASAPTTTQAPANAGTPTQP